MKKIFNRYFIFTAGILASIIFCSCDSSLFDYGLHESFYRANKVERRARNLKNLNKTKTDSDVTIETNIDSKSNQMQIQNNDKYDVLIITDVHFGNENKSGNGNRREADWIEWIKTTKNKDEKFYKDSVKFAICLGDVADHGLASELDRFDNDIRKPLEKELGIPLFNVVGNHDLYNSGWTAWEEKMYPHTSFYKFETPSFSWYFLDSASDTLGVYQFEALEDDMNSDSKPKLIFTHVPVYAENRLYFVMQNTEERNKLISLCAKTNTKYFIDGHTHKQICSDFGSFTEQNVAGFLAAYKFAVLHVNESSGEVSIENFSY